MQVEIEEKVVGVLSTLRAQAAARRMPFDAYLEQFVEPGQQGMKGTLTLEEFDRILDELSAGPIGAPPLPADFSRADSYAERN